MSRENNRAIANSLSSMLYEILEVLWFLKISSKNYNDKIQAKIPLLKYGGVLLILHGETWNTN
jgi:hypothetical protein